MRGAIIGCRLEWASGAGTGLSKDGSPWRSIRSHSIEFKRQVAQEFLGGETLPALAAPGLPLPILMTGCTSTGSGSF